MRMVKKYRNKIFSIILLILIAVSLQWGYRLIAFFCLVILLRLVNLNEQRVMVSASRIQDIFYRKTRILKRRIYPVKELLALNQLTLGEIIQNMESDHFHIIHVSDEDCHVMGTLTEQEILSSVVTYDSGMSLGELVSIKQTRDPY